MNPDLNQWRDWARILNYLFQKFVEANINEFHQRSHDRSSLQQGSPWAQEHDFPWANDSFNKRMLQGLLNDLHDFSSHRPTLINAEVRWIHREILEELPSHILVLCCGPKFHTQNLAVLVHQSTSADFSPASVEYARALTQSYSE